MKIARQKADAIGRDGENRIASILKTIPNSTLFRNIYVPCGGKNTIEIDALLVTSQGLFVIEIKALSGQITGSTRLNLWTQTFKKKAASPKGSRPLIRNKFYNPIKQNKTHIDVLSRYLKLPSTKAPHSIIVFTSRAELKKVPPNTKDHAILQESMLRSYITRRINTRKEVHNSTELNRIIQALNNVPKATTQLKKTHIAQAKKAELKRKAIAEKRCRQRKRRSSSYLWFLFLSVYFFIDWLI